MIYEIGKVYKDLRSNYYIFITNKNYIYNPTIDKYEAAYKFYYLDLPDEVENMYQSELCPDDWIEV